MYIRNVHNNIMLLSYTLWGGKSNYGKGVVLYTGPPTEAELIVICCALWNDESKRPGTPKLAGDDLDKEILERALLVGPCPSYILNFDKFRKRFLAIKTKVKAFGGTMPDKGAATGVWQGADDVCR